MNTIRANFFKKRIDDLLPDDNFYFHKIFKGQSEENKRRNALERKELEKLVENHLPYRRYYIEDGQIEPLYLTEEERRPLTDGMTLSLEKIFNEVVQSNKRI